MDQEFMDGARQAFEGLAVLSAIPVVFFALWAEYFGAHLDELKKEKPDFDRKLEIDRAKMASTCVLLFEIVLFLGSVDLLKIYPKGCAAILFAAVVGLRMAQSGLEKKLVAPPPLSVAALKPSQEPLGQIAVPQPMARTEGPNPFRALLFGIMGGLFYMFTLIATVKAFAWIAQTLKFSDMNGAVFVMLGAAVGIFLGLILNFALAPWQMRNSLPVTRVPEGELREKMKSLFSLVKQIEFFIVEVEGPRTATAMVAGFSWGAGLFQPAVFISRSLVKALTAEELAAVIAHESAHIARSHLAKRVALSGTLIVGLTFMSVFAILMLHVLFPAEAGAATYGDWQGTAGTLFGFVSLVLTFRTLSRQSRKHETEADIISVNQNEIENWAQALRKIDELNGISAQKPSEPNAIQLIFGQGHLPTESRIALVRRLLNKEDKSASEREQTDRAA